ncbi:hypothetical protein ACHAWF_006022 [Thalassiosira exigua]
MAKAKEPSTGPRSPARSPGGADGGGGGIGGAGRGSGAAGGGGGGGGEPPDRRTGRSSSPSPSSFPSSLFPASFPLSSSPASHPRCNVRHFLKVGLALAASFHFGWISRELSELAARDDARVRMDERMLAPEGVPVAVASAGKKEGGGRSSTGGAASASGSGEREGRWPFRSPFDPRPREGQRRGRSLLPVHPRPNAELSALVAPPNGTAYPCPEGLVYVSDHVLPDDVTHPTGRKIPRTLHVTSKSRCMSRAFASNAGRWVERLGSKYSIYIHDDDAVDRFFYERRWTEFGELKEVASCVTTGAAKAEIWRYIMIWEYGGVYSDLDSGPAKFNVESITDDEDVFFPLEGLGIPAQYWFAASPRHPGMYMCAKQALQAIAFRDDISKNNVAKTTGPGAFKVGLILFQQFAGIETNGYVDAGTYEGEHGRTVKVVGLKANPNEWIVRYRVGGNVKEESYAQMGMTHFFASGRKFEELHRGQQIGCLDQ